MTKTKVLGLTGGIASGKSTVSNYFKEHNIPVIDADIVAREVTKAGEPALEEIRHAFGDQLIQADGEINREKLGAIVFESDEKREILNKIVHKDIGTRIKEKRKQLVEEGHPIIVLDIPLLFEAGYDKDVDEVMVVYVDSETQKDRLLKRDPHLSEEDALNRIQSQMPLQEKADRADILINNDGSIEETIQQVQKWLDSALAE